MDHKDGRPVSDDGRFFQNMKNNMPHGTGQAAQQTGHLDMHRRVTAGSKSADWRDFARKWLFPSPVLDKIKILSNTKFQNQKWDLLLFAQPGESSQAGWLVQRLICPCLLDAYLIKCNELIKSCVDVRDPGLFPSTRTGHFLLSVA